MLASVVIFARNKVAHVARALRSALAQTYSPLEILVSDQASTDGTREVIHKIAETYSGPHELRLLDCPSTEYKGSIGLTRHMNWLMEHVRGEVTLSCAADDYMLPHRAEHVVQCFQETGAQMVACKTQFENGGEVKALTQHDREGWLDMKEIVKGLAVSSSDTNWRTSLWKQAGPMPELCTFDVWLPPIALVLGGVWFTRKVCHTYIQHADVENQGLDGVIRALAPKDQTPVLEAAQFQLTYTYSELMKWFATKGLGSADQLQVIYEQMMEKYMAMLHYRKELIYNRITPYRMNV